MELYDKNNGQKNDINDMQLSYKHWVSLKNHCSLDFKCMSAANEDFDPENIIFYRCLLHVIHDVLVSDEFVYI